MKKILVVDDEPDILRLYSSELEDEGYRVRLASDGEEAEKIVNSENVDLVILDIKMQKKDGLATLTQLKRMKKDLPMPYSVEMINYSYTGSGGLKTQVILQRQPASSSMTTHSFSAGMIHCSYRRLKNVTTTK